MRTARLCFVTLLGVAASFPLLGATAWAQTPEPQAIEPQAPEPQAIEPRVTNGLQLPTIQAEEQSMPPAPPEDQPVDAQTVARLSDISGSVRVSDKSGKLFDQALQNMAVLPGMTVETGGTGRAELEFPDGSLARVTPNSGLTIGLPARDSVGRLHVTLQPSKGLTYYELALEDDTYRVQVGPLAARPAAGATSAPLLRVNLDATPYEVAVLRGTVHFEDASGNAAYDLETSQTARIDPASATDYDIVLDLTPDTWDAWNADRDNARAQIATSSGPAGQGTGPGWNDLNYYGSWYDVPGQGMAWAPDGVGENFDPYGSGAWGYYTGVGYGWVSSYPWGWLPYHCGAWNYYQSYGWAWLPSGCGWGLGNGWYPYTGIGNTPPRYHRPSPPRGIYPVTAKAALVAVHQGPPVRFRTPGAPRLVSRPLVVAGVPVQPMPLEARPGYRSVIAAAGLRGTDQSVPGGLLEPGGYVTRGSTIAPVNGLSQGVPRYTAAPRQPVYMPVPRMSAPPAPMPAPHIAAPAAPIGHGH